jgi:hypothetical protein
LFCFVFCCFVFRVFVFSTRWERLCFVFCVVVWYICFSCKVQRFEWLGGYDEEVLWFREYLWY